MQYHFGSGNLYGIPSTGIGVPRKFGALQDVSIDISFSEKALYGQQQFGLDLVRGQGKIAGKAKFANINGALLNDLFFSQTQTSGNYGFISAEAGTVPTTPFTITVANGATFKDDLGVTDAATGLPMTRVSSAPATGQYSVNAVTGVYTFAAADVGKSVLIDYSYTIASSGVQINVLNVLAGTTNYFQVVFPMKRIVNGVSQTLYLKLFKCASMKLALATKNEDFLIPEFDFSAVADAAGTVAQIGSAE